MSYAPWSGRRIGIELELNRSRVDGRDLPGSTLKRAVARGLTAIGAAPERLNDRAVNFYHSQGHTWDVKTDSSCGWEIASPILTLDDEGNNAELSAVVRSVAALTPQVDRRCGHHLHVDVSDLNWQEVQKLCWLWARYEPFFNELVHSSRRSNAYCFPLCRSQWNDQPGRGWTSIAEALRQTSQTGFNNYASYFGRGAFNMAHWWRGGRIEIRLHHGTVSYAEIRAWAMLVLALVGRVKQARLPEVKPFTPSTREAGFHTYYIWKAIGLTKQRDHEVHASASGLFRELSDRRVALNPGAQNVQPYRDRAAERLRALATEAGALRPSADETIDMDFHRQMNALLAVDRAVGNDGGF